MFQKSFARENKGIAMAIPIQKLREAVFQLLYSMEFHKSSDDELMHMLMQELKITKKNASLALEKTKKIVAHQEQIDTLMKAQVESYEISRIHSVERTILRLAIYECIVEKSLPLEIAIAEAKRLVRKFSTQDAEAFVQAILDAIYKKEIVAS